MPTARRQTFENALFGRLGVEMELLRIEFTRECDDAFFGHVDRVRTVAVPDVQVFQVKLAHALFSAPFPICHAERKPALSNVEGRSISDYFRAVSTRKNNEILQLRFAFAKLRSE